MPYRQTEKVKARLAARREAILAAAMDIVRRDGLAGLSTDAVAARAKLAVGTVYLYFADKVEIVAAIAAARLAADIAAIAEVADSAGDPVQGLGAAIGVLVNRYSADLRLSITIAAEPLYRVGLRREFERKIAAAAKMGLVPQNHPDIQAAAILGAIEAVCALGQRPKTSEPLLVSMALGGIGAKATERTGVVV